MPSAEINFDELKLEIAPKQYLPVTLEKGSAEFHFDKYGTLNSVDGIYLSICGETSWELKPYHDCYKLLKSAIEDQYEAYAWDETGETAVSQYEQHSTY